ncbi:MAG TPA: hypothetical protein VGN80_18465 [Devosiaceae bacterium]|jgi:hypothetical protein|nr:hypothetical protein [Devosiaceae bacterium]
MATTIDIEQLLVWAFRDQAVETSSYAAEDAVTVYWAVLALPAPHCDIVRFSARSGDAPPWHVDPGPVTVLAEVRQARARYREWVRALAVLQRALDGTLREFRTVGPAAPEQPWLSDRLSA